jgi:hypothetical protein
MGLPRVQTVVRDRKRRDTSASGTGVRGRTLELMKPDCNAGGYWPKYQKSCIAQTMGAPLGLGSRHCSSSGMQSRPCVAWKIKSAACAERLLPEQTITRFSRWSSNFGRRSTRMSHKSVGEHVCTPPFLTGGTIPPQSRYRSTPKLQQSKPTPASPAVPAEGNSERGRAVRTIH